MAKKKSNVGTKKKSNVGNRPSATKDVVRKMSWEAMTDLLTKAEVTSLKNKVKLCVEELVQDYAQSFANDYLDGILRPRPGRRLSNDQKVFMLQLQKMAEKAVVDAMPGVLENACKNLSIRMENY